MATNSNPVPSILLPSEPAERRLTREEGWNLIISSFGTAKEAYAEVGGAEAFLRAERAAWGEDEAE